VEVDGSPENCWLREPRLGLGMANTFQRSGRGEQTPNRAKEREKVGKLLPVFVGHQTIEMELDRVDALVACCSSVKWAER